MIQGCLGLILLIIIIAIVIAIIGFVFKNIIGFIGIGLAIWGIYEWSVNHKLKAESKNQHW